MTTPKQLRCVIYVRVSLDATGEGRSVERQLAACRKLADYRGHEVVAVLTDNSVSAYGDKKRPGWVEVLGLVAAGEVDVVVAWHMDRMTRSMVELEHLIVIADRHGVGIETVAGDINLTSDMGRMIARILAAVARAEVERKAARQRSANEQRAASGAPWPGGARPFGYGNDQLSLIEREVEAILSAAAWALSGVPMREIARRWEAAGLVSSRSSEDTAAGWTGRGVKGVLTSPRYAGIRTYKGREVGPGAWPAILDMETHLALKARLLDPLRRYGRNNAGTAPSNLLSGLASCGICGTFVNASSYRQKGERFETYTCRPGQHVQAVREAADTEVEEWMVAFLAGPEARQRIAQATGGDATAKAQREMDEVDKKLNELVTLFNADVLTAAQLSTGTQGLRQRRADLTAILERSGAQRAAQGLSVGTAKVVEEWQALSLEEKRRLIATFADVEILPPGEGKRLGWDAELHMTVSFRGNAESPSPE